MKTYKLADSVLHRVVQIVQEAFLTGVDCADIMRQIELEEDATGALVQTEAYKSRVKAQYEEMEKFALEHAKGASPDAS